jgi:hypothetical protein
MHRAYLWHFVALLLCLGFVGEAPGQTDCADMACCGDNSPTWTVGVNWLYLWRETTGSDSPLIVAPSNGQSGIDTYFKLDLGCGHGFEARYLWAGDYGFSADQDDISGPSAFVFDWDVVYDSRFQSAELLGRRDFECLSVTYGFRWANLDETRDLTIYLPPGLGVARSVFGAQNNLYGFQLGTDGTIWEGRRGLGIDGFLKAGIYGNDADISADRFGVLPASGTNNSSRTAFLGELGLTARYDLTDCLRLRSGYQLLFLDGVALASDQVPGASGATNIPASVGSNSLLYHGLNAGLELRW